LIFILDSDKAHTRARSRFTIRRRIYFSFFVLIGIFAFNGFITWRVLESNIEINNRIFEVSNPTMQALERFKLLITESKMLSTNWVFLPAKSNDKIKLIDLHESGYPVLKNKLNKLSGRWNQTVSRDSLLHLFTGFEKILNRERDLMQMLGGFEDYDDATKKMEAELMLEDDIIPMTQQMLRGINSLIEAQRHEIRVDETRLLIYSERLRAMIIWMSAALIVLSLFFSWYMGNFISRPIIRIKNLINKLGKGIIDEIPERKQEDEINDMIRSVNDLSRSLRETAGFAEEIGKGNFKSSFSPLSENDTLGRSLISMRDNLRRSEALLQEAQELTHNGSWEFELSSQKVWFSDESYRILGWRKGKDEPNIRAYLRMIHPDDFETHAQHIKTASEKGIPQAYDLRIIRKDGSIKYLQKIVKPVFDDKGQVIKLFGTILDIDERKSFEADLIKAKEAAEAADRTKSLFLSNMSHEIRTPMNAIIGLSDLMMDDALSESQKQRMRAIRQSGENLLKIINEILDFSKIEAGKLTIEHLDFNIRDVIHDAVQAMSFGTAQKGLEFQVNVDPDLPEFLNGDPYRLNQILLNLIGNAIKFTEKGSVKLSVTHLMTIDHYSEILFSVTDTGIGIPDEQHEKIFESFNQAQIGHSRKYGGTGLGLTITRQLIELQGGRLSLQSKPGKGSTFSFRLRYSLSFGKQTERKQQEQISSTGLKGIRMLIVEDNITNQYVAGQILSKWGIHYSFAMNGKEAIMQLRQSRFDLILMDLQMPEMDGYEASQAIRSGASGVLQPDIPIIALSADAFAQTREKALAAGMNAYLSKPIHQGELYKLIQEFHQTQSPTEHQTPELMANELPDLTYLLQVTDNNPVIVKEILQLALHEIPEDARHLHEHCLAGDWTAVSRAAHKMKSNAGNLGLNSMKEILLDIERLGKEGKETEKISGMVQEVIRRLESVYAFLRDYISN
jgi:PAS domain S-box-containing protein